MSFLLRNIQETPLAKVNTVLVRGQQHEEKDAIDLQHCASAARLARVTSFLH